MLKNYYFYKWKQILVDLKHVTDFDLQLQDSKSRESELCVAAQTLTGMLARYIVINKEVVTILQHNLQIQKTSYMQSVADALDKRIAELKSELSKLESSNDRFFTNSLISNRVIPQDIEPAEIVNVEENDIHNVIKDIFEKIRIKKERGSIITTSQDEEGSKKSVVEELEEDKLDAKKRPADITEIYAVKVVIPPEVLEMRFLVNLIKANERCRQTLQEVTQSRLKRETWEKDLLGTLNEPAPKHVQERASALIKDVLRAYFQKKRDRIVNLKTEEKLEIRFLKKPPEVTQENDGEEIAKVNLNKKSYEDERQNFREQKKEAYMMRKCGDLVDDHRDYLRDWFQRWHNELQFFYDIPKNGGSVLILKEEVPEPQEWREKYEAYVMEKKANKNKTKHQLKMEKQQALKAEKLRKELEKSMNKKKKNKNALVGYTYPRSTTLEDVYKVVEDYHRNWDEYDFEETPEAKIRFVKEREYSSLIEDIKMQTCFDVDPDMTLELKALWKALKYDYENYYDKPMPEKIVERKAKHKKKNKRSKKAPLTSADNPYEFLEILVEHGLLVQYQKNKFKDFVGDPNFAGNEIRCGNRLAQPNAAEFRRTWWDTCQDAKNGFRRILLLGPRGNGRTTLVHILASSLDAVLLEINPEEIQQRPLFSAAYLQVLVKALVTCLKSIRPLVVYIKNMQHVFPKKGEKEATANARIINNSLIKKIFKVKVKAEQVTIIGSLSEPWACRSGQIVKRFPVVLLIPDTNYSATDQLLNDWILSNCIIPRDFPTNALAQTLRGFPYGFLKDALDNFLTGERIIKIAAFGLTTTEVFGFIMERAEKLGGSSSTDYDQYRSWYLENTVWGKKETNFIEEQKELKEYLQKLALKKKQKINKNKIIDNNSLISTIDEEV